MLAGAPIPHEPTQPWLGPSNHNRSGLIQERLKALGAFSCIAIGAVAGVEMVIGGGFDFINLGPDVREVAPSNYVTVYQAPWSSDARVIPLSSTEPLFAGDFNQVATESDRLNGSYDDAAAPEGGYPDAVDDDLYREIAALYESDTRPAYEDAPAVDEPNAEAFDPYAAAEAMTAQALADYEYADADPS